MLLKTFSFSPALVRVCRYKLMPQARAAVISWSLDIRPNPINTPSSTAIGNVSSRKAGMMYPMIPTTSARLTP